jgi:phenazine biosynthesis protein phzE
MITPGQRPAATPDLLDRVLAPRPPAFALLYRPETTGPDRVEILLGEVSTPALLAGVPLPAQAGRFGAPRHNALVLVPYQQVTERGFAAPADGSPLIVMSVTGQSEIALPEALRRLPDVPINLTGSHFDIDDDTYAETVRAVLANEIGTGEGANFVIKRSFVTTIADYSAHSALTFFRKLLERESGAYWTFIVHTGTRTFVGATPERHVSLRNGVAVMNPISGTYRYPPAGPVLSEVIDFLADRKETDELYMVVDEELKMMARICDGGGRVVGPFLREMTRLAHTEYLIEGRSGLDPRDILRETMFAPTVTGSPLESACRVISRYEPHGRGYYSGIAALIGHDGRGERTLDSAILIRTADLDEHGRVEIGVGATLVRHSDPVSEVAETRAKAAGLLTALGMSGRISEHPLVQAALMRRNETIAGFWLSGAESRARPEPVLTGLRALVIDAEDSFMSMLDHQLRSMGLLVHLTRFDRPYHLDGHDLIVLGPGPGDPRDTSHPKIAHLSAAIDTLLAQRTPFLAVCLSHQVLSSRLGFDLVRRDIPNQGIQREINLFGSRERVGFYNTFMARSSTDTLMCPGVGVVEISRDVDSGEIHALRGPHFRSVQFHLESVLTQDGVRILAALLTQLVTTKEVMSA